MNMQETPFGERIRISFFGRRNAGKSSLINAVTGQNLSIVSPTPGTTADPVNKTMEILPLGPVVLTDTAGIDDTGELGQKRTEKTYEILDKTDIGIIVFDINQKDFSYEKDIISRLKNKNRPYIVAVSKDDEKKKKLFFETEEKVIFTSSEKGFGIEELKNAIGSLKVRENTKTFLHNIAEENRIIVLVCPIDWSAPKGRLIMPQVMAVRNILDEKGICIAVQPEQLKETLEKITPYMVITDSQAFAYVNGIVPDNILLTSFSVLMANYKSDLKKLIQGAEKTDFLKDGDRILIAEACTHHAQKNDIGKVQIPKKLREYTGKDFRFDYISGSSFPLNLSEYSLVIHCGGCMISETAMVHRQYLAERAGVPMTNYGILLAKLNGILERVTKFVL